MDKTVAVIFSKNRAMQCDALLNSLMLHCEHLFNDVDIRCLYTCSPKHEESYENLKQDHLGVQFVKEQSFKDDFLKIISHKSTILFLCDDSIVCKDFSIKKSIELLKNTDKALGFSLRLGNHSQWCYPLNVRQDIPDFEEIEFAKQFRWTSAEYDFAYPFEVSSSIYRLDDIRDILENTDYFNPNSLESVLSQNVLSFISTHPYVLCYENAPIFSVPVNRVQTYNHNRCGTMDADAILEDYMNGFRIDVDWFSGYVSSGAHEEVNLPYVRKE